MKPKLPAPCVNVIRQAAGDLRLAAYQLDLVCDAMVAGQWDRAAQCTDVGMASMADAWKRLAEINDCEPEFEPA